jgi:mannose-1-phosphate guanylyltransferase/mannose-6-phosphate isomerase
MLKPVLLSGGVGSRLWPVSREAYPKQFLPLAGEQSMLVDTLHRLEALSAQTPMVVCNDEHRFIVAEQLREAGLPTAEIVLEPCGRNTAPAVAVAALQALKTDEDAILLVLPADHLIENPAAFHAAVREALPLAEAGHLVTFGVVPTRPETGYGYIKRGEALSGGLFKLESFVEKPDADTAEAYLQSGDYLWNSGKFLFGARTYIEELKALAPAMLDSCSRALEAAEADLDFVRLDAEIFASCPSDSIDYAVMEKTTLGAVAALDCGWSDVGAWSALWDVGQTDDNGNVVQGDVLVDQSQNNYLRSESRLLAVTGISDLVVVETADAVLVSHRDTVQDVKRLVTALRSSGRDEASVHARVYRPWGSYESLITSERFQVKSIVVNPGQKLSLQKHHHRAEHWIVVNGTAEVTCEDKVFTLAEDESTYIPLGHKHRLANPGCIPLELIEVQSGSYLGEDDIVRYEDIYGRSDD